MASDDASSGAKILIPESEDKRRKESAKRQRQHVARKQQDHFRLQCWISLVHADQLQQLAAHLEDSQASLIEQAISLLYQQEFPKHPPAMSVEPIAK